jgi:putative endonuclease
VAERGAKSGSSGLSAKSMATPPHCRFRHDTFYGETARLSITIPTKVGAHFICKVDVLRLSPRQQALWNPYIGTTSDLVRRVWEHKDRLVPGFTKRYDVERLVWFEVHESPAAALQREKQIKEWKRDWKINLLERDNPSGSTFTQASDFEHCSLEG